jgi:Domain of unknown function (DUF4388)
MTSTHSSDEVPPASLVASLSGFTLSDILGLLASTAQTGELRVVNETIDGRLWFADGQLSNAHVGAAATIGQAVFELAHLDDGWAYFTVGVVSSSGHPTVPVAAVLDEVRPHVEEWRTILQVVRLEAVVSLSPDPPGGDVQIRSDQWRVLTAVGTGGQSVKDVLDQIGGDQIVGLRTLRDLHSAGLVALSQVAGPDEAPAEAISPPTPTEHGTDVAPQSPPTDQGPATEQPTRDDEAIPVEPVSDPKVDHNTARSGGLAEVATMPAPLTSDPWAPVADAHRSGDNGAA